MTSTKPTRRLMGLLLSIAMMVALIPAIPAFAAPAATASLTAGASGFPGSRTVAVRVDNPGNLLTGTRINFVSVTLPTGSAGITLPAADPTASGWTVRTIKFPGLHVVEYTATGPTGGIAPGSNASFSIPVEVARPKSSRLTGDFRVDVSDNGGQTIGSATPATAGALTAAVDILELVPGSLKPTGPLGAADGTGTAGQVIGYEYKVKNYASQAVDVTGNLTVADDKNGVTGTGTSTATVPGNDGTATLTRSNIALGLGSATADRNVTFTANVEKTGAPATKAATALTNVYTIQVPAILKVSSITPARVRSTEGNNGVDFFKDFNAAVTKVGSPVLKLDSARIQFAGSDQTETFAPQKTVSGATTLTIKDVKVVGGTANAVTTHNATFSAIGIDGNDFAYSQTITTDASGNVLQVIIDNLRPDVTVTAALPTGYSAAKKGTKVDVTATLAGGDLALGTLIVKLQSDAGEEFPVSGTTSTSNGVTTFTGSASPQWKDGTTKFFATASVEDTAGNLGSGVSTDKVVDLLIPQLTNPGTTGRKIDADGTTTRSTIRVVFADGPRSDGITDIRGGCNPELYRIDGVPGRISKVTFEGETDSCVGKTPNGSGVRVLWLNYNLRDTDTPQVNYLLSDAAQARSVGLTPVHDGAINDALAKTIDTVRGIVPNAPEIRTVQRENGAETATFDSGRYWVRTGGASDALVTFVVPEGSGYIIQVLDGNDTVLVSKPVTDRDQTNPMEDGLRKVNVPLPAKGCGNSSCADGDYVRKLRFVYSTEPTAPKGLPSVLTFALDTVSPTILTSPRSGDTVTVTFSEKLQDGSNFARDWFGRESDINNDGEPFIRYIRANSVQVKDPDSQGRSVRELTIPFTGSGTYAGVDYVYGGGGARYLDRAGNTVKDTLTN